MDNLKWFKPLLSQIHGFVKKINPKNNNSIQSIHKPGSSKTLNMEKKFKV